MRRLLIHHIGQLLTMRGYGEGPLRGSQMANPERIYDAAVLIENGIVRNIGSSVELLAAAEPGVELVDAAGALVTPGLVDAHTHLVHGGSREHELAKKIAGVTYLQILQEGGGILSTVEKTRAATADELYVQARRSLHRMLAFGVTTVEAKSGYGLDWETERKQLEVARRLAEEEPQRIVSTFLGAHAVPREYRENVDAYVDEVIEMIDYVVRDDLADFCDVFCETGVFTIEQSRRILEHALAQGLGAKIHADEIDPLGGTRLAAELNAASADHLIAALDDDLARLAASSTIPVLLPGTSFYLGKPSARARDMIDKFGLPVAIASDYNPGSCPTENLQLIMTFAGHLMKLQPLEVITAVTRNAACAIGLGDVAGVIDIGRPADLVVWAADNPEYLIYHYGVNLAHEVYIHGRVAARDGVVLWD